MEDIIDLSPLSRLSLDNNSLSLHSLLRGGPSSIGSVRLSVQYKLGQQVPRTKEEGNRRGAVMGCICRLCGVAYTCIPDSNIHLTDAPRVHQSRSHKPAPQTAQPSVRKSGGRLTGVMRVPYYSYFVD